MQYKIFKTYVKYNQFRIKAKHINKNAGGNETNEGLEVTGDR